MTKAASLAGYHLIPAGDLLAHDPTPECLCGVVYSKTDPNTGTEYVEPLFFHRPRLVVHRHRGSAETPV